MKNGQALGLHCFALTVIPSVRFLIVRVTDFSSSTAATISTSFRASIPVVGLPRNIVESTISNSSWVQGAFLLRSEDVFFAPTVIWSVMI